MAKREYSNGLQHLKFMQRAQKKEEVLKHAEVEAATVEDSHWVLPTNSGIPGRRCAVILEGDPKPGALLGRMSFQSCNAAIEKLVDEVEVTNKRRFMVAKEKAEGASTATHASLREGRDEDGMSQDDEQDMQKKKPKVAMQGTQLVENRFPVRTGTHSAQGHIKEDHKPWQGWKGGADYRLLRPPGKR